MKRTVTILTIVIAILAGAVGVGWLYFQSNPAAWDSFLAEMGGETGGGAPEPARRPARRGEGLVASLQERGVVVPAPQDRGEFDRRTYTAICLELWLRSFAPGFSVPG